MSKCSSLTESVKFVPQGKLSDLNSETIQEKTKVNNKDGKLNPFNYEPVNSGYISNLTE